MRQISNLLKERKVFHYITQTCRGRQVQFLALKFGSAPLHFHREVRSHIPLWAGMKTGGTHTLVSIRKQIHENWIHFSFIRQRKCIISVTAMRA